MCLAMNTENLNVTKWFYQTWMCFCFVANCFTQVMTAVRDISFLTKFVNIAKNYIYFFQYLDSCNESLKMCVNVFCKLHVLCSELWHWIYRCFQPEGFVLLLTRKCLPRALCVWHILQWFCPVTNVPQLFYYKYSITLALFFRIYPKWWFTLFDEILFGC